MTNASCHPSNRNSKRAAAGRHAFLIGALLSASGWAYATECSNGGRTRSIEVVYSNPGQAVPCEVIYDKSAEGAGQHSLWRASNEAGYCEAQAAAFVEKLSGLGWTCTAAATPAPAPPAEEPAAVEPVEEMLGDS